MAVLEVGCPRYIYKVVAVLEVGCPRYIRL